MARGLLGRNSPIQFRQCRRDALKQADLVILAGNCHASSGRLAGRPAGRPAAGDYSASSLYLWSVAYLSTYMYVAVVQALCVTFVSATVGSSIASHTSSQSTAPNNNSTRSPLPPSLGACLLEFDVRWLMAAIWKLENTALPWKPFLTNFRQKIVTLMDTCWECGPSTDTWQLLSALL